ncbi:MAG TPA: hypothetical protein VGN80_11275 [Devosiaceae bacterium]|jgi:hypothetical protein|nr:hypothetical protein [Devosiaceae bacterium]
MPHKYRPLLAGAVIGSLAAALLAVPSLLPAAMADEQPMRTLMSTPDELMPAPFDTAGLVKPDFMVEPSVSTEVIRSSKVRKIGYGRTSFVTIAETASGTYSSDGLASPHVRYPGIYIDHGSGGPQVAGVILGGGSSWTVLRSTSASSFVSVTPFEGGKLLTTEGGSCVITGGSVYC